MYWTWVITFGIYPRQNIPHLNIIKTIIIIVRHCWGTGGPMEYAAFVCAYVCLSLHHTLLLSLYTMYISYHCFITIHGSFPLQYIGWFRSRPLVDFVTCATWSRSTWIVTTLHHLHISTIASQVHFTNQYPNLTLTSATSTTRWRSTWLVTTLHHLDIIPLFQNFTETPLRPIS